MPHQSLKLIPGVDTTKTPALNEAAISESKLIRFIPDRQLGGLPQKLGGWTKFVSSIISSTVKAIHAWADTNSNNILSVGAVGGVYAGNNDTGLYPISPQEYVADITVSFTTSIGSNIVTVTDTGSNVTSFDSIFLETQISVGGLVLFGYYSTIAVSANTYQIKETDIIGNPIDATSAVSNGGSVAVFSSVSGSLDINVLLKDHGYSVGSTFTILIAVVVGGVSLYGNYTVNTVVDTDNFTISGGSAASSSQTISINGGRARIVYYIGQQATQQSGGFGSGGFGAGGFGVGTVVSGGGRTVATTNATTSGTIATFSFARRIDVPIGTKFVVSGVTPTGYNGSWIVTESTLGAISTISADIGATLGAQSVAGTISFVTWGSEPRDDWSLDNWGEDLIACPLHGTIYSWTPNTGAKQLVRLPNAPEVNEGAFVAMPQRQIIAFGSTFDGIQDQLLVRWCDIGNNASWIATVANQAGSYRISKGSKVIGAIQGPQQGLLWTDVGVWSIQYIGQPYVYSFNEIAFGCGLVGRKAMGILGGSVYWMSQSQFYRISGSGVEPIQCSVWDKVFQEIDPEFWQNVRCAPNSRFGEISWYYPVSGSDGVPTRYVKYNAILNQWDFGTLTRTAWIDQSVFGPPIGADITGYIYQHETQNDADGEAFTSGFTTGYFALSEGDLKVFIDQIWPDMKWGESGTDPSAQIDITIYSKDYPGQTPNVYGPFRVGQSTQFITPRLRGRLISIEISSSDVGSFWRLGNIRYRSQPDGVF